MWGRQASLPQETTLASHGQERRESQSQGKGRTYVGFDDGAGGTGRRHRRLSVVVGRRRHDCWTGQSGRTGWKSECSGVYWSSTPIWSGRFADPTGRHRHVPPGTRLTFCARDPRGLAESLALARHRQSAPSARQRPGSIALLSALSPCFALGATRAVAVWPPLRSPVWIAWLARRRRTKASSMRPSHSSSSGATGRGVGIPT
jgi:hypothetical protein